MANNSKPKTNGNDPVGTFPTEMHPGLTKREWLSGVALQGLLTDRTMSIPNSVKLAVESADKLIEELNK